MRKSPRAMESKVERVAGDLRQDIVEGRLTPGTMLPKWDDLQERFDVCRPTLTQAVHGLKVDGFVRTHRSQGTFVHDRPPHLVRFGIVFASDPARGPVGLGSWNQFWDHLAKTAPLVEREFGVELPLFLDVTDEHSSGYATLTAAIRRQTVGGLIIVGTPALLSLPAIAEFSLPKVAIFDGVEGPSVACPRMYFDFGSFVSRSLELLKEQGRRRVGFFHMPRDADNTELQALHRRGVETIVANRPLDEQYRTLMAADGHWQTPEFWHFQVGPAGLGNVVRLLMHRPTSERPDALVVSDDNLVPAVLAGVAAAGIRVPRELTLLTHVNWPLFEAATVPVQQLGFDVPALLRGCVETISHVRARRAVAPLQLLPAITSAEYMEMATRKIMPFPVAPASPVRA